VSDDVIVRVGVDTTEADADITTMTAKLDAVTQKAREVRDDVYRTVSTAMRGIQQMIQAIRMIPQILGMTLDPLQSALLSTLSATVALMTSMAVALTPTPLVLVGIALGAAAVGIQISSTIKIAAEMSAAYDAVEGIKANIARMQAQIETGPRF